MITASPGRQSAAAARPMAAFSVAWRVRLSSNGAPTRCSASPSASRAPPRTRAMRPSLSSRSRSRRMVAEEASSRPQSSRNDTKPWLFSSRRISTSRWLACMRMTSMRIRAAALRPLRLVALVARRSTSPLVCATVEERMLGAEPHTIPAEVEARPRSWALRGRHSLVR